MKLKKCIILVLILLSFCVGKIHAGEKILTFLTATVYGTSNVNDTTTSYNIQPYEKANFLFSYTLSGLIDTATLTINLEFSDDDSTYYKVQQGSFADFTYTTTNAKDCYFLPDISANYARFTIYSTGFVADTSASFSVKGIFK